MQITDDVAALLARPNHAIVGTNRKSGPPQLTVTWYLWDGRTFAFTTRKDRAKYTNLQRDPSMSLLVNDQANAWYVVAYGRARILDTVDPDFVRRIFARYLPGADPSSVINDPMRVTIVLEPDRIMTGR